MQHNHCWKNVTLFWPISTLLIKKQRQDLVGAYVHLDPWESLVIPITGNPKWATSFLWVQTLSSLSQVYPILNSLSDFSSRVFSDCQQKTAYEHMYLSVCTAQLREGWEHLATETFRKFWFGLATLYNHNIQAFGIMGFLEAHHCYFYHK